MEVNVLLSICQRESTSGGESVVVVRSRSLGLLVVVSSDTAATSMQRSPPSYQKGPEPLKSPSSNPSDSTVTVASHIIPSLEHMS